VTPDEMDHLRRSLATASVASCYRLNLLMCRLGQLRCEFWILNNRDRLS
jgi:hypothetical protein